MHKTEASTKPKNLRANTRNPTEKFSYRVEKTENTRRTSVRLRKRASSNTPSSLDVSQKPSNQYEDQASTRQRKRRRNYEEKPPLAKRARTNVSAVSHRLLPLTAETLQSHIWLKRNNVDRDTLLERYLGILEPMGSEADNGGRSRGNKRSASRVGIGERSTASTGGDPETASQVIQKSSFTAAHYRNFILKGANISLQSRLVPEDIRTQISAIVQLEVSPRRKEELSCIAHKLHDDFADVLNTAAREDDCIELVNRSLRADAKHDRLPLGVAS
ncbi:hypothetical protein BDY21DRAFT_53197 [Lineolata rhizophorae]|uniref:Uncharacterized protein n=1 Tax=Lineolata rhizophorae TaxID=578093 RepID=A0A6A6NXU2_9PEZI|nr:hypothetical protein BDY21DRAFT_53197 [Lineolata rhizophorae]